MSDARPTSLAAAIDSRRLEPTEQTRDRQRTQQEQRRTWGRALNADVRRDAEILRDNPHYLAGHPTRLAAAQRYIGSGLLDAADNTDPED